MAYAYMLVVQETNREFRFKTYFIFFFFSLSFFFFLHTVNLEILALI